MILSSHPWFLVLPVGDITGDSHWSMWKSLGANHESSWLKDGDWKRYSLVCGGSCF